MGKQNIKCHCKYAPLSAWLNSSVAELKAVDPLVLGSNTRGFDHFSSGRICMANVSGIMAVLANVIRPILRHW